MYKNHLNSYNSFIDNIPNIISELPPLTIQNHKITIQSLDFTKPYQILNEKYKKITPQSCLEALETYRCKCELTIRVNNQIRKVPIGTMPVMVGSKLCHKTVKDLSNNLDHIFYEHGDQKINNQHLRGRGCKKIDEHTEYFDTLFERSPSADTIHEPQGGYFIINGQEKVVRFLIVTKRHIPFLLERSSLGKKNKYFTDRAVQFRSVKNERGYNYFLHLCHDKNVFLRFIFKRKEYTIPVILILKALKDVTDREIVEQLGEEGRFMLDYEITTRKIALSRLEGLFFSLKELLLQFTPETNQGLQPQENIYPVANAILDQIFCHLSNNQAKFSCLILCLRKLLYCKQIDDMDTTANHEIVGIGQLLSLIFFDKLMDGLDSLCKLFGASNTDTTDIDPNIEEENVALCENKSSSTSEKDSDEYFDQKEYKDSFLVETDGKRKGDKTRAPGKRHAVQRKDTTRNPRRKTRMIREDDIFKKMKFTLCAKIEYFLNTGNIQFVNSTDMLQSSGLAITADRLNLYRFISQFESVNRGAFFSQLKTTTVRLLRPESYGFLCPVHTPDGAPCGLILHLSSGAIVTHSQEKVFITTSLISSIHNDLRFSGDSMKNIDTHLSTIKDHGTTDIEESSILCIMDGEVLGTVDRDFIDYLRRFRQTNQLHFEIVEKTEGLYIFTQAGRLMRPVYIKNSKMVTWIGVMEQTSAIIYNNEDYSSEYYKHTKSAFTCKKNKSRNQESGYHKHMEDTSTTNRNVPNTEYQKSYEGKIEPSPGCNNPEIPIDNTPSKYFYREIHTDLLFSYVAGTIPFLEYNQSPRNMYECQMVKQAMSYNTLLNITGKYRCDNKAYSLTSLQQPLVTTNVNALMGINVFIAVLCYTSYDMEDAMVLNMSSVDRGLFDGAIYKVKFIDKVKEDRDALLRTNEQTRNNHSNIDRKSVRLPEIGRKLEKDDVFYSYKGRIVYYRDEEPCSVHFIRITPNFIIFTLRIRRRPEIGDKFCSRHGQKGVMSRQMRSVDLPFNLKGLSHDLIINPHAFPSRMTIGMMMEILISHLTLFFGKRIRVPAFFSLNDESEKNKNCTGQSHKDSPISDKHRGSEQGDVYSKKNSRPHNESIKYSVDESSGEQTDLNKKVFNPELNQEPFRYSNPSQMFNPKDVIGEKNVFLYDRISQCLKEIGLNPFSNELMMSGITGRPLRSLVFSGMCYYQRLRHMVLDKWQVRSTGLVDVKTRQPVKGRKRGGGVRFGEMEKAALIAHGTASLLQDRLMDCSDKSIFECCMDCKTFLFVRNHVCLCGSEQIKLIQAPFVLKYLLSELLSMNIFVEIDIAK